MARKRKSLLIFLILLVGFFSCGRQRDYKDKDLGDCTDIDGNSYETVEIGNQIWMAENLRATHFRDGTAISRIESDAEWQNLAMAAYCYYENDTSHVDTYGLLYNWHVIGNFTEICPEGWHVPTDEEWQKLEINLGMSEEDANLAGARRGNDEASKLAGNASLWTNGILESNPYFETSGFDARPGGYRFYNGEFINLRKSARFWTATESNTRKAWSRNPIFAQTENRRIASDKSWGLSIRCIKGDDIIDEDLTEISGTVIDSETEEPIENAHILFNGASTGYLFSGADGSYIYGLEPGDYSMTVSKEGYENFHQEISVVDTVLEIDVELQAVDASLFYTLSGTILDAGDGLILPDANILIEGPSTGFITSDSLGEFSYELQEGDYIATITKDGYYDEIREFTIDGPLHLSIVLTPIVSVGQYRIVLTWSDSPEDLDSHLWTPLIDGYRYHIYYVYMGSSSTLPYASLDVDQIFGYGPETITISQIYSGTYYYSVFKYYGMTEITDSEAIVRVFDDLGIVKEYHVPASGEGDWWNVFQITDGTIQDINTISEYNPFGSLLRETNTPKSVK